MPDTSTEENTDYLKTVLEKTRSRLLDKTRRNRLLNFKESARDVAIIDEMPDRVFEHLVSAGAPFYFDHYEDKSKDIASVDVGDKAVLERTLPKSTKVVTGVDNRYTDNRLQTPFAEKELEKRLRKLYQEHRTVIEETGANNLYLALGFLNWFDSGDNPLPMKSPLVLLPVKLEREKGYGVPYYKLIFDDEVLDTNYSLAEKLKHSFDITLPLLNDEQSPESYWEEINNVIERRKKDGWCVIREMSLGLFRFNKQVMWHDLNPDRWPDTAPILENNTLKRILLGAREGEKPPGQITDDYPQDDPDNDRQLNLIRDADSSQYSALVDSLFGEDSLVIEGPPGTGKSQTISNLIVAALDEGKKVLFVAEKMAALNVVYDRLEEAGLGDFCLQLHGLKTSKKEIINSVLARLEKKTKRPTILAHRKSELNSAREELIQFSKILNEFVGPEDIPLHSVAWKVERLRQQLPDDYLPVDLKDVSDIDYDKFTHSRNMLNDLGKEWAGIPEETRDAWYGYYPDQNSENKKEAIEKVIKKVINGIDRIAGWLNNCSTKDEVSSLYEVFRLLKIGEAEPESLLPKIPSGNALSTICSIVNNGSYKEYDALLEEISKYLLRVEEVNKVFDYQSDNSDRYAGLLETHCNILMNKIFTPSLLISTLPKERDWLEKIINHLESMEEMSAPVIRLTNDNSRTIEDYKRIIESADNFKEGPEELSIYAHPDHAKSSVTNHLKRAQDQFEYLSGKKKILGEYFDVSDSIEAGKINKYTECIKNNKDKWFVIFNKQYRESKRYIFNYLLDKGSYSRKDTKLLSALDQLVEYCVSRDLYENDETFKIKLGAIFKGVKTDWKIINDLILHSQVLKNKVGIECAQEILNDWDDHIEKMDFVINGLHKSTVNIEKYKNEHALSPNIWDRPIADITNTLKPWLDKLNNSIDDLVQKWCNLDTSLEQGVEVSKIYSITREHEKEITEDSNFKSLIKSEWDGANTRIENLVTVRDWIKGRLDNGLIDKAILKWIFLQDGTERQKEFYELVNEARTFRSIVAENVILFKKTGDINIKDWVGGKSSDLNDFKNKLINAQKTLPNLSLMVRWQIINKQVYESGLKLIAKSVSDGVLLGDACGKALEYSIYQQILKEKIQENATLNNFGHIRYENLRERYSDLDREILQLNADNIANKLCSVEVPQGISYGRVGDYTELSLLRHEANKRRAHIPVRKLVSRATKALTALKPCFLMSPISVAQYLKPGTIEFDLVVMDEASQLRPEDALGSIARAKKAIIVGDPKQLPPTSFFETAVADEDAEETIVDDTESILDVCLKQFPYRRLRWHYRSQHESLIQFSNDKFYDGDLIVFPSPMRESREYGVHYNYIDNPSYKSGRNSTEAEVVVENIIKHYRKNTGQSLGVAAFNKKQTEEIQLLLEKARREYPEVDKIIAENENTDPLFIKNLENVQGDERDVIFISTTYGPEKPGGPVFQRFGPINSDLGWRRLNVIATRARQRIELFTSMRPTDIKIGDNARKGIRALRDYLEYVKTGLISDHGEVSGRDYDSDFEVAVAKIVRDLGYDCDPQVGVAGFYIDIGVKHPDRPGEYLMGIECDGATYHSAVSVRDRDRLRQEILESKGWHIHRIWSTSWFHVRSSEIERLESALKLRLEEDRKISTVVKEPEEPVDSIEQIHASLMSDIEHEEEEIDESLDVALERFWDKNIKPIFADRQNSILSKQMILFLIKSQPETEDQWFKAVPIEFRENMDRRQRIFLEDILDVIAEYA